MNDDNDDGAWVYYNTISSPCEPSGLGELKMLVNLKKKKSFIFTSSDATASECENLRLGVCYHNFIMYSGQ